MNQSGLLTRYFLCERCRLPPNSKVLAWFWKADREKTIYGEILMVISLDRLANADISPLVDTFRQISSSEVDTVNIVQKLPCLLNADDVMSLIHSINNKLNVVDFQDPPFGEDFLRSVTMDGITCRALNFWTTQIQKLNMVGRFSQLHSLNLDFCTSIASLHEDCFSDMPKLVRLSMCEARITNLLNTTAVLSKLPSLAELRFQKCLCCLHTGPCSSFYDERVDGVHSILSDSLLSNEDDDSDDVLYGDSELRLSTAGQLGFNEDAAVQTKLNSRETLVISMEKRDTREGTVLLRKYISHHPSPIYFQKYYRVHMIV